MIPTDAGWSTRLRMAAAFRPEGGPLAVTALHERMNRLEAERTWAIQTFTPRISKIEVRRSDKSLPKKFLFGLRHTIFDLRQWLRHPVVEWDSRAHV